MNEGKVVLSLGSIPGVEEILHGVEGTPEQNIKRRGGIW